MKFGLTKQQYDYILEVVVRPLENSGAKIWAFGSRARGDHAQYSDLDLMVESEEGFSSQISEVLETLSESNFPYKVDLVSLNDFAESYKDNYEKEKIEF